MPDELTWILGDYNLLLLLAAGVSLLWLLWTAPQGKRAAFIDTALGALVLGLLLGRALHVLLWWEYFAQNNAEILSLVGVNWHGVVIGGVFGGLIAARWRGVTFQPDAFALLLPLLTLALWTGCAASGCAYGHEIRLMSDYPAWLVWDARDIYGIIEPRFASQPMGIWLGWALLGLWGLLQWRGWLRGVRFWLLLLLLSAGMFGIGFLRADYNPQLYNLRADQWLDFGMFLFALIQLKALIR